MTLIIVSEQETTTNADMLAGTRLESMPAFGQVTFEFQAADCIAANQYVITVTKGEEVPLSATLVPQGQTAGVTGVLDDATALIFTLDVAKADKVVLSSVLTGTTELMWRATFRS